MSRVVKFSDGKEFAPKPAGPGGKLGRKCPRWPKDLKAAALGCAVAISGTEESLERDRSWAARGLNRETLAKAVDLVLPGALDSHAKACGYTREYAEKGLFNRLFRMYNVERKAVKRAMPDSARGGRSLEHLFNWPDKARFIAVYEHALQFGTRVPLRGRRKNV